MITRKEDIVKCRTNLQSEFIELNLQSKHIIQTLMGRYHDPEGHIKSRMVIQFILLKQVSYLHRAEIKDSSIKSFNNMRIIF